MKLNRTHRFLSVVVLSSFLSLSFAQAQSSKNKERTCDDYSALMQNAKYQEDTINQEKQLAVIYRKNVIENDHKIQITKTGVFIAGVILAVAAYGLHANLSHISGTWNTGGYAKMTVGELVKTITGGDAEVYASIVPKHYPWAKNFLYASIGAGLFEVVSASGLVYYLVTKEASEKFEASLQEKDKILDARLAIEVTRIRDIAKGIDTEIYQNYGYKCSDILKPAVK